MSTHRPSSSSSPFFYYYSFFSSLLFFFFFTINNIRSGSPTPSLDSAVGGSDGGGPAGGPLSAEDLNFARESDLQPSSVPVFLMNDGSEDLKCKDIRYSGRFIRLSSKTCKEEAPAEMLEDFIGSPDASLLQKFGELRMVVYRYNKEISDSRDWHLGFIAEEVEEVSRFGSFLVLVYYASLVASVRLHSWSLVHSGLPFIHAPSCVTLITTYCACIA